jgi:hypothetical protein
MNKTLFTSISVSVFFLILSFTKVQAQCCSYNLSMGDTYGDGWNGGFVEVKINNAVVGIYSANNYGSNATFLVCNGDSVSLNYTAGAYENENTYQLYDNNWNLLFSDGPIPLVGSVFDTIGNCNTTAILGNNACNAIVIDTNLCVVENNIGIQGSGINAGCANVLGGDMWFSMIVPPSGNLTLATDSGTIDDTGIAAWLSNGNCASLQLLGCDDDAGNGYYSMLNLYNLPPAQTLYIQVWGYGGNTGSFKLCAHDLGTVTVDSTELPLILINTLGQPIVQDNKINALMDIKYNGVGNITHITNPSNIYSGNIGIEIRGATSAGYPQVPYNIETRTANGSNNNVSLLGMPAENDWLLLSNYNDRSLIRNTLAYKLFGEMGNYSVKTRLCEVLVDSVYKGIYVFGEKIKVDNNRLDIAKLTSAALAGDDLTGGYILEQNLWDNNNSFESNFSPIDHPGFDVHFKYKYPSADSIQPAQKAYIAGYVDSLETALYSANFNDATTGYRKYLDTKSFIDYFIINELSRNGDGFKKSVYFHKDKFSNGGKLKAGPAWDFDWAWKTLYGCSIFEGNDGSGWAHHINDCPTDNFSCGWYIRLLQDSTFSNELKCIYTNYRQTILSNTYLNNYIDSVKNLVINAQVRHFKKWPILGVSGPAPEVNAIATSYLAEMDTLKQWIAVRLQWLDNNMPGVCTPTTQGIQQIQATNLLNYFPNPSNGTIHFEGKTKENYPLTFAVYDVAGKLISSQILATGNIKFDYQLNKNGLYYFKVSNNQTIIQYGKLVIVNQQ